MSENTKPNNERPADLAVQDSVGGMARRLLNPAHLAGPRGAQRTKTLREQGAEQLWRDVKFRVGLAMHHDDWRHRADIPLRRELKAQRAAHLQGPKISIIVPLYNTPAKLYLRQMLQSVVRQTYTNWELVLVDASDADKRLERRLPKAVPGTIVYLSRLKTAALPATRPADLRWRTASTSRCWITTTCSTRTRCSRLCRRYKTPERILSIVMKSSLRRFEGAGRLPLQARLCARLPAGVQLYHASGGVQPSAAGRGGRV